jgi:hypothetical protein
MKGGGTQTAFKPKLGTDWDRLRRIDDTEIRKGIESDSDVRSTDEEFWKNAKVVLPRRRSR